jgi:hypothetical protein
MVWSRWARCTGVEGCSAGSLASPPFAVSADRVTAEHPALLVVVVEAVVVVEGRADREGRGTSEVDAAEEGDEGVLSSREECRFSVLSPKRLES